jgi:hypothetical protein
MTDRVSTELRSDLFERRLLKVSGELTEAKISDVVLCHRRGNGDRITRGARRRRRPGEGKRRRD